MTVTSSESNPPLLGDHWFLIDVIATLMQRMAREHREKSYQRIEQLENQGIHDDDRGRRMFDRRKDNKVDSR